MDQWNMQTTAHQSLNAVSASKEVMLAIDCSFLASAKVPLGTFIKIAFKLGLAHREGTAVKCVKKFIVMKMCIPHVTPASINSQP
jgi:uncharacterized membrane protein